jgi:hypothetical protein
MKERAYENLILLSKNSFFLRHMSPETVFVVVFLCPCALRTKYAKILSNISKDLCICTGLQGQIQALF